MKWDDVTPDFRTYSATELCTQMSFSSNCWLIGRKKTTSVLIAAQIFHQIQEHLREGRVEMGGLLLGRVHKFGNKDSRTIVHITNSVRAAEFRGTAVSLRMDTEVWNSARSLSKEDEFIVGWYHSHPNLGVFFSGTDRKTQKDFFDNDYSLGLVIDPVRNQELWFLGGDSLELDGESVLKYQA
jgi:proteasome lid subunit RPN8/RPN11